MICQGSENCAQHCSRIFFDWNSSGASLDHLFRAVEEAPQVKSHGSGGNHAEVGEGGVASANAGHAKEDVAESVLLGNLLHFGTGIGDGDKLLARFVIARYLLCAMVEVLLEDVGFQRAAGFAG